MAMELVPDSLENRKAFLRLFDNVMDLAGNSGLMTTELMSAMTTCKIYIESSYSQDKPLPPVKLDVLVNLAAIEGSVAEIASLWTQEKAPTELNPKGPVMWNYDMGLTIASPRKLAGLEDYSSNLPEDPLP